MFCPKCGSECADGAQFCGSCGASTAGTGGAGAARQESAKVGGMRKCPACGAPVVAGATACTDCGHEFSGVDASRTIRALYAALEAIENERSSIKPEGLSKLSTSEQIEKYREDVIRKKKAAVIRDFPVPNSRDEIMELVQFIQPKVVESARFDANYPDWNQKFQEVMGRAKAAYKGDRKATEELAAIEASLERKKASYAVDILHWLFAKKIRAAIVLVCLGLVGFAASNALQQSRVHAAQEAEKTRLEAIVAGVNHQIAVNDLDNALVQSAQIKWLLESGPELRAAYDDKREQIAGQIRERIAAREKAAADQKAQEDAVRQKAADAVQAEQDRTTAAENAVKQRMEAMLHNARHN